MSKADFLASSLLIVLLCGFGFRAGNSLPEDFDYFTLAFEWPASFCKIKQCNEVPDVWIIHGLWPSKNNQVTPKCQGENFKVNKIPFNIRNEMSVRWKSITQGFSNEQFWRHEWNKHGKCAIGAPGVGNLGQYFTKAIELAKNYDIYQILKDKHIEPGQNPYIFSVRDAFMNPKPFVKATNEKSGWPGKQVCKDKQNKQRRLLFEIHICFRKENFALMDCPAENKYNNKVFYTPPPHHVQ